MPLPPAFAGLFGEDDDADVVAAVWGAVVYFVQGVVVPVLCLVHLLVVVLRALIEQNHIRHEDWLTYFSPSFGIHFGFF